ncbi:MAG TPA: NAD(P)/FAD-dependent oxidoreductase [Verrucomicrobia bacterium]|nr:NAD(P)/FAD-dependent oxidoreductase [Verrucomicrobiota bacterium]HOP96540.1 NAD(P)/FAD-dependent oxidoreductase [Verrucomicrobiota bacterium]HPU56847.1 NAD(P)/FAD-dependent oxidoreductase [Verrucomicrobiota bacterium]
MAGRVDIEVLIVGAGLAGLSAAVYLGSAQRQVLVIDSGKSMARWEPEVQNYLGFPEGISGETLLARARKQAGRYHVAVRSDEILSARAKDGRFELRGRRHGYACQRLLIATGIFHIPPDIPGIRPCLGHGLYFCKDCDGYRVQGKDIAVYGWRNETVDYALGMLLYSPCVTIVTDGHRVQWDDRHGDWIREYHIPVYSGKVTGVIRKGRRLEGLAFADGRRLLITALFTTRGDVYLNQLARDLDAETNADGEIVVDQDMRTSVPGVYAAGCVTPANCQMIIAAGQGATAAQAINRDLFLQSLGTHSLRQWRGRQLKMRRTRPAIQRSKLALTR